MVGHGGDLSTPGLEGPRIQQIVHERVMFAPILEPAFLNGVGPRVGNNGLGAIANFPYSAPNEDLTLKAK